MEVLRREEPEGFCTRHKGEEEGRGEGKEGFNGSHWINGGVTGFEPHDVCLQIAWFCPISQLFEL